MKLTLNLRLLLILLAVLMALTACTGGNAQNADSSETVSASVVEKETETATETEEETEVETEAPLTEYRASISKSRAELEEMLTLQDEEFGAAQEKLKAFEELALVSSDYDAVDALYMEFEDAYFHIETQIGIANVIYYMNTTNSAASERYLHAYDLFGDLHNAYIESCKNIYNNSPIRDRLFEDWTEDEIAELFAYDPKLQELREENEELLVELNALPDEEFTDRSAEIYAILVTNNNEIAELSGYENYYLYASDRIYGRDYDIEDIERFASYVQTYYLPNQAKINLNWQMKYAKLSAANSSAMYKFLYDPFDKWKTNYVEGYLDSFEGSMYDGLNHMFDNRNLVFASSKNSHQSAFQTYLSEYETPFCLFGCNGQSATTIIHEMGHYYAALYNDDVFSYDLAETQSQTNEILFLAYLADEMPAEVYEVVRGYSLYNFMVQSIICVVIDEFERQVYSLESVEGYTSEDFDAIMEAVCEKYGGASYIKNAIVDINMYWRLTATNSPVYYISYAVSNTESLNIFAIAEQDEAAARELYRILIEETEEVDGFLSAVDKAGLASPFEEELFEGVLEMMLK